MRPPLILAYHGVSSSPRHLDPHNLMVDPAEFRRQLQTLRRGGYRFLPLLEFAALMEEGGPPDRVCALTFDDGIVDNLTRVAPLLDEFEAPATFFVCPGLLGEPHFGLPPTAGVRLMTADELRELASLPLAEIGSHTSTHADLSVASEEEAHREMASSKEALEELLQLPIRSFAYPKCGYSPACPPAARRAGYTLAVTCAGLGGWRPFELAREAIDSLDGRVTFALKSRRIFSPLRGSPVGRLARAAVRPVRHNRAD
jgi:peptidoglycan/xylan/chitin deacetylase (PgdA/CDA1 family)